MIFLNAFDQDLPITWDPGDFHDRIFDYVRLHRTIFRGRNSASLLHQRNEYFSHFPFQP